MCRHCRAPGTSAYSLWHRIWFLHLRLLLLGYRKLNIWVVVYLIPYDNFCVADDDGGEGYNKLSHVGEGAIHKLRDPVPGLLTVEVTHIIRNKLHKECVSTHNKVDREYRVN